MAEKLFKNLESTNKRFEVKIMTLDVISRLVGIHNLFLFNLYPYIQRFMQPHQREVTRILQFCAQASHDLLPPDTLEPILKIIANNFVTERNSSDVMAIGLNAMREICARCPLAMEEDLLRDLVEYKTYRERSVMMAARGLIQLFRTTRPELLHKKDRGRPTEASEEIVGKQYAEMNAKDYVPGAEVLLEKKNDEIEVNSSSDSDLDDEQWIDVDQGPLEQSEGEEQEDKKETKEERKAAKAQLAKKVTLERILTDEDFKQIDMANIKKQVVPPSKGMKRKLDETAATSRSELVKLSDIENIFKKRKHDKESRLQTVQEGRVGREKFGYKDGRMNEHCSRTNREKRKTKNYQMIKHKVKGKTKRSFKEKQQALRNYLVKQKRMK